MSSEDVYEFHDDLAPKKAKRRPKKGSLGVVVEGKPATQRGQKKTSSSGRTNQRASGGSLQSLKLESANTFRQFQSQNVAAIRLWYPYLTKAQVNGKVREIWQRKLKRELNDRKKRAEMMTMEQIFDTPPKTTTTIVIAEEDSPLKMSEIFYGSDTDAVSSGGEQTKKGWKASDPEHRCVPCEVVVGKEEEGLETRQSKIFQAED